jgi:hypothetical protein
VNNSIKKGTVVMMFKILERNGLVHSVFQLADENAVIEIDMVMIREWCRDRERELGAVFSAQVDNSIENGILVIEVFKILGRNSLVYSVFQLSYENAVIEIDMVMIREWCRDCERDCYLCYAVFLLSGIDGLVQHMIRVILVDEFVDGSVIGEKLKSFDYHLLVSDNWDFLKYTLMVHYQY